jgi:hypothetical protein
MDLNDPARGEPVRKIFMVKVPNNTKQGTPSQGDSCAFPFFGNVVVPLMATLYIPGLNVGLPVWLGTIPNVLNSLDAYQLNTLCHGHNVDVPSSATSSPPPPVFGESTITSNRKSKRNRKKKNKKKISPTSASHVGDGSSTSASHVEDQHPAFISHAGGTNLVPARHTGVQSPTSTSHVGDRSSTSASHVENQHPASASHVGGKHPASASHVGGKVQSLLVILVMGL